MKHDRKFARQIVGERLDGFEVESDGSRFSMSIVSPTGGTVVLSLPAESLQSLIMTLPHVMAKALKAKYRDDSLRLVYPADKVCIEQASDLKTFIVTMTTADGFSASFGLDEGQMNSFGEAIVAEKNGRNPDQFPN